MVFPNSSVSDVTVSQVSQKKKRKQATTNTRVHHSAQPQSSVRLLLCCFVSACPSSSYNQRPEPFLHSLSASHGVVLHSLLLCLSFFFSPFFLRGPRRNKLVKQETEKHGHRPFQSKSDGAVESSPQIHCSSELLQIFSPCVSVSLCLLPSFRESEPCLCAQGFDTAIQALPLP